MKISEQDLTKFSTIQTKSYAKYFCIVKSIEDIVEALKFKVEYDLSYVVLGKGSNILFSKKKYDDILFIKLSGDFEFFKIHDQFIEIGAAFSLKLAGKKLIERGYKDYIFFNLIPASLGGAITQNAGIGKGAEIKDVCESIRLFDVFDNKIIELNNKECMFSYRNSIVKKNTDRFIILSAKFNNKNKSSNIESVISLSKKKTKEKVSREPIGPSFGSTFMNNRLPAWKCVEHIKGELDSSKGVFYSNEHSNWIINNKASGEDIVDLISETRKLVKSSLNIDLLVEVKII